MSVMVHYRCEREGCTAEEILSIEEVVGDEHGRLRTLTTWAGLLPAGWRYERGPEGDNYVRCPNHPADQPARRREHGSENTDA